MGKCFLIRLARPAALSILEGFPDNLPTAKGGFNPCALLDFLVDPITFELLGIVFRLSSDDASVLCTANPEFDARGVRLRKASPASLLEVFSQEPYAQDDGSYLLQIVWAERENMQALIVNEPHDYWYAEDVDPAKCLETKEMSSPAHRFVAVAVSLDIAISAHGGACPREFSLPMVDQLS